MSYYQPGAPGDPNFPSYPTQNNPYPTQQYSGYPPQAGGYGYPNQPPTSFGGPQYGGGGYGGAPPMGYPTPTSMPMPYAGVPPQTSSPYPNLDPNHSAPGYPQGAPAYPPQAPHSYPQSTPYPQGGQSYPQGGPAYPPGGPSYPQSAPTYPQQSGYPSQTEQIYTPSYNQPLNSGAPVASNKPSPTVRPVEPFNPRADAEVLRKAMKGFGTDEKSIIEVLTNRSNSQRLEIGIQFKTLYGKDLIKDLKSEISGRFEDLVVALMTPLPQFYAKEIADAMTGLGTDEDTLVEVFCTMNNQEILVIKQAYEMIYRRSLEKDLMGETSGSFRRLLVSLCCANRDESYNIDQSLVQRDAQELLRAGEMKMGTDESTFNAVLCQRSYAHLKMVFDQYQNITGHDFENAIKNEFSGDIQDGLLAIVRSVRDKAGFFAKRLQASMAGMGTNDKQLIRIIVTRSEVDMGDIKQAFEAKYGKGVDSFIRGDCSGDYKKCLLALIQCS